MGSVRSLPVCAFECVHLMSGLHMSAGQKQVIELSGCGHPKPKLMVLSKTSAKIYWVADIMSQGQQLKVAAAGCFQYCWVYLQLCKDYMLIFVNKTAALFSTGIGPGICWFPWWQQVFYLCDYFALFIDQQMIKVFLPHAVAAGTTQKWPFHCMFAVCS